MSKECAYHGRHWRDPQRCNGHPSHMPSRSLSTQSNLHSGLPDWLTVTSPRQEAASPHVTPHVPLMYPPCGKPMWEGPSRPCKGKYAGSTSWTLWGCPAANTLPELTRNPVLTRA